jgi:hypothetical protein
VLLPLQKSASDPFQDSNIDIHVFGWVFALASSHALRNVWIHAIDEDKSRESGFALVPCIDIASHSFQPNCEIVDSGNFYELVTVRDVVAGEELTINYGALRNDELLLDYGFTVDNNPYDEIKVNVDEGLINLAR